MTASLESNLQNIFPACHRQLGTRLWQDLMGPEGKVVSPASFPELLARLAVDNGLPPWLPDLARLELALYEARTQPVKLEPGETIRPNPSLSLIETEWNGLPEAISGETPARLPPEAQYEYLLVWRRPDAAEPTARAATPEELLALKLVAEGLDFKKVARENGLPLARLAQVIDLAVNQGLLIAPPSKLRRDPNLFSPGIAIPEKFLATETFTLQWHLTQACDLHCRHCYDRSHRRSPTLTEALAVLDQLHDFCRKRHVHGQVSFTGGNPLLHPDFLDIYRAAAERGLMTAILGNPAGRETLAAICAIQKPEFYQVSLEGMEEHNDYIRGPGHFERVLRFLDDLREAEIYSMVMLTLTRDNLDQVLALAETLRGRADLFTFNRLSAVGEGAQLVTPDREGYRTFLPRYLEAARENPTMGLKDSLINIIRLAENQEPFGGCAGFGCGAAFNFVALLPDGEVHACRKFPSPVGNLAEQTLGEIYDSPAAARYRRGPENCRGCRIRHVCGGCLAVISSQGLDPARDRDPCCFID